jgi:hypothetical protein
MQKRRSTLSPAMVVSLIALFVALGGTSYAAITALPANSVGTPQLKNNAVTGTKIKDGAITGAKINAASLESSHVVGAAGEPAYQGVWKVGEANGGQELRFYKDPWGIVHFQGGAATTSGSVTGTIFNLPIHYLPGGNLWFTVYGSSGTVAYIEITVTGAVNVVGTAQNFVSLSGLSFRAG